MATNNPNILFQVIDDTIGEGNIQGTLDVYNPKKFPLALTFTIKDVMDMTSSKGSFSKSFKIPATTNNNEVLKFLISDSFYESFQYVDGKKARIFVDGNLILEGAFQVKGHGVDQVPEYYECLVFGDNFKWVNAIDRLNLCDIDFDAGGFYPNHPQLLIYGREQIMDTWEYSMSGQLIGGVGTHIVYPLVNTGKWTYGNFAHPDDMAPAIFILDMIKVILGAQGYTLQSNFMNTDWFKKLISVTPKQDWENSDAILELYQFEYEQEGGWTEWKTPMNFRTDGGHTSDFMGAFRQLEIVCPTCDPSNLIQPTTWYDNYIELMASHNPNFMWYYSGWYWGAYGYNSNPFSGTNNTSLMGKNPGGFLENICNETNPWESLQYHGSNWNCVWLNAAPLDITGINYTGPPMSGYSQPFQNCDRFQTNFFGKYVFNGSCRVEMDNRYVIDNEPEDYDPMHDYSLHLWSGMNYDHCGGMLSSTEYRYQWTDYKAQLWLMHYEAAADKVHAMPLDEQEYTGFCTIDAPLSPTTNLTFDLSFSGIEIDILDGDDYVYYYTEVNEIGMEDFFDGWSGAILPTSVCQCKYRMQRGTMNGGITEAIVDGGSVNIGNLLPCDVTQLEWLNGLTGMFNLYWQSDEMTKTIYCEPRDMFFEGAGTAVNWTDKLDWGEKQTSRYVYDALKRNLCFTYENDGQDAFVEERNRRKGQICELGSEVMDLGELFVNEDEKIGSNYYAPTYMFRDKVIATNTSKAPFIPVIHSEYTQIWSATANIDYPDKIEEHKARILLWGGKTPLNHSDGFSNSNKFRWGKMNPSASPDELNYYPFAGVYCDEDEAYFGDLTIGGITYYPQLYYQNVEANMVEPTPATWPICNGLYEVFWERNINNLISRPTIKSAKFHLTSADISDLKFQRLVYIENSESATYYIINKVVDFKPAQSQMTKVELFEWSLAKPRTKAGIKRLGGQEYGPDRDSGIGQIGTNKNRLETNYASELGITGTNSGTRINSHTTPNLVQTSPIVTLTPKQEEIKSDDPNNLRWKLQNTTGALTTTRITNKSFNIGNNVVQQNTGKITIGQNNKGINSADIVIGKNNQSVSSINNNVVEFHTGQAYPALVINEQGEVLEGGGGVVFFEDTSGNFVELVTKTEFAGNVNYKKVLKTR